MLKPDATTEFEVCTNAEPVEGLLAFSFIVKSQGVDVTGDLECLADIRFGRYGDPEVHAVYFDNYLQKHPQMVFVPDFMKGTVEHAAQLAVNQVWNLRPIEAA